jgi:hypothetical protein
MREVCSDKPMANERFVSASDVTGPLDFLKRDATQIQVF